MKPLVLLTLITLICRSALAQGGGVYRAPRPRPPATAGILERDPVTGNYRLTYTDEAGQSYTVKVESRDRVAFELRVELSADSAYATLNYVYQLKNTATSPEATKIYSLILVPCDDLGATVSSNQWVPEASVLELISARACEFGAPTRSLLAPGSMLTDAKVTSRWLPGIGRAMVSGEGHPPVWPSGEATPTAAYDLARSVNSAYLGGKKIDMLVPLKDPASFATADRGIGLVQADLSKTCTLGWVKSAGICNSLEVKLNHAQAAIAQSDLRLAGNHLKSLQNELSAQRGKDVDELAFLLLSTNVGFIQFHLAR